MPHIYEGIHVVHLYDMRLVMHEVRVCLDGCGHFPEIIAVLDFDIDHPAVYSCPGRNSHGKGSLHSFHSLHGHSMPHTHSRAEIGVCYAFGRNGLKQGAYYGIASRIPACGNH